MIRILIADDHHLLLDGLSQALGRIPDFEVAGAAATVEALRTLAPDILPDVLLVDIEMPDGSGLSALRDLGAGHRAVIMTMHADDEHRNRARAVGARAFLSKATPLPDVAATIRAVHAGESLIDADDPDAILDRYREPSLGPDADSLTAREREILALLARGISGTADIADELYISHKTVKNHLASIYEKLRISDRTQAAVEAIRLGLGPS